MKYFLSLLTALTTALTVQAQDAELSIVKVEPEEGSQVEQLKILTLQTSNDESVGYVYYKIFDLNASNPDDSCIMAGEMKKQEDGTFAARGLKYIELLCYAGHEYENNFYCYSAEEERYYEEEEGCNAMAVLKSHFFGATSDFQYSPVEYLEAYPVSGTVIEDADLGNITLTFSGDVAMVKASINGGMFGNDISLQTNATADASVWEVALPSSVLSQTSGSIVINVEAFDADALKVKGNVGEGDESVIELSYQCYLGSPSFVITPAEGEVCSLSAITASYAGGINLSGVVVPMTVTCEGEMLAEIYAEDAEYNEAMTTATLTLPSEITAAGTYEVCFPAMFFALGEQYSGCLSKSQSVTYTVVPETVAIKQVGSQSDAKRFYNLLGQPVREASGIVIAR